MTRQVCDTKKIMPKPLSRNNSIARKCNGQTDRQTEYVKINN